MFGLDARRWLALIGIAPLLVGVIAPGTGAVGLVAPCKPNPARFVYDAAHFDLNGNGIDDQLDQALSTGASGSAEFFLHYCRPPTHADATLLRNAAGATRVYLFSNWDMAQVSTTYDHVPDLKAAAGVLAVEEFQPPIADLDVATKAIRVRPADGLPIIGGIDHAQAVQLPEGGPRGEGMVIAVMDTGVDNGHESLDDLDDDPATNDPKLLQRPDPLTGLPIYAGVWVLASPDAETALELSCTDPDDSQGHGTSVAGIALGTGGPTHTFQGVAPRARLVDVDVFLPGHLANPVNFNGPGLGAPAGFDWIIEFNEGNTCYGPPGDDVIDVLSLSLSSGGDAPNSTFNRLINGVVRSGITVATSAGNQNPPDGLGETLTKGADGAIIVANVNIAETVLRDDDKIYGGSGRGPRASDGDADALDELRPDIGAPGVGTRTAQRDTAATYSDFGGTSAATPFIAGVAALMLQVKPSLRPIDQGADWKMGDAGAVPIRDLLQQTAQHKTATQGPAPQFSQVGRFGLQWNNAWGYGEVDAFAAVIAAQNAP